MELQQAEEEVKLKKASIFYSDAEACISQGNWKEARELVKKLQTLDQERAAELLERLNLAEGDDLVELARQIIRQEAWEDAQRCCTLLESFDPKRAQELANELEQAKQTLPMD